VLTSQQSHECALLSTRLVQCPYTLSVCLHRLPPPLVQPLLLEEGLISDFRSNLVCNVRLTKEARAHGLTPYMHPPRYAR
jgi:hypothetical protein